MITDYFFRSLVEFKLQKLNSKTCLKHKLKFLWMKIKNQMINLCDQYFFKSPKISHSKNYFFRKIKKLQSVFYPLGNKT